MIQKKRTLRHFGLDKKGVYRGEQHEMHIRDIKDAIDENQMAALIGQFGSGKTTVADFAIQDLTNAKNNKYKFVHVDSADLEKLSIGNIIEVSIMDLSNEKPFRSVQARSRQSRRIMGELVRNGFKICLVIDNAHRLHPNVLMALKDEHEKKYMGRSPLFSIIYIGQEPLIGKLDTYKEVFWRTLILNLQEEASGWMSFQERMNYLTTVYGPAISPGARDRIARKAKVPLEMEFIVTEKMEEAKNAGKDTVDEEVVELTIRERREALGISQGDLAKASGAGKTTIHEIEHGHESTKKADVEKALEQLEAKKYGDGSGQLTVDSKQKVAS